jgi:hypothetical protein
MALLVKKPVAFDDTEGDAYFQLNDELIVGDRAFPRRIEFQSGGGPMPWLTMRIEVREGVPVCTFLQLESDNPDNDVRMKHLKYVQIEQWITHIVSTCSRTVEQTRRGGWVLRSSDKTREGDKAVERMQRRRRDPNDRELLERVAALYTANPDAPLVAIGHELGMSPRTAARWAARCSDAGLLPKVSQKGQKRL